MTTSSAESAAPERLAVVVLGMHRSGTSALAGLLTELGCDGPAGLLAANEDNPLGHFEAKALHQLHDRLLASAGSSWHDYREFPQDWIKSPKAREFRSKLVQLLDVEYGSSSFFVLKDPRICRLLPLWKSVLDAGRVTPLFVYTHRNPLEVAASLKKRNGFDLEYSWLLWLRHVLDAEAGSRGTRRSFTSYDRLIGNWPMEAEKIGSDLGLSWPRYNSASFSRIGAMIRPELKRNSAPPEFGSKLFAQWLCDVQAVLERWAENGENAEDFKRMDDIRRALNDSSEMYGSTVQERGSALVAERDAALQKAGDAGKRYAELKAELDSVTVERDHLSEQLQLTRNMLEQRKAEIDDTSAELEAARKAVTEAESRASDLAQQLARVEQKIDALQRIDIRRNREFAELQTALLRYQDVLSRQRPEPADPRPVITALAADELARVKAELDQSNARINDLLASNSWKVTGPLRWISGRFKK